MRFFGLFSFAIFFCCLTALAEDPAATPVPSTTPGESVTPVSDGSSEKSDVLPTNIYKHFRFADGQDAVPGPTPTPIMDLKAFAKDVEAKLRESAKEAPNVEEVIKAAMIPPDLPKCFENTTENVSTPDSFPEGLEGDSSPVFDVLFIDDKEVPEDYDRIFGITTIIVPLVRENPNFGWELIYDLEVPCLPYRLRFQGSKIYVDKGLPALKNYAKGPKGEYHPYIKARYDVK